jgi:hypothetical protein
MQGQEKSSYYTPNIEDLRIGYQCEADISFYTNTPCPTWNKNIFKGVGPEIINYHAWGMYRTPYLTKEQIIDEEWEYIEGKDFYTKEKEKGQYWTVLYKDGNLSVYIVNNNEMSYRDVIDRISCPSINEFRYINKLLKITK